MKHFTHALSCHVLFGYIRMLLYVILFGACFILIPKAYSQEIGSDTTALRIHTVRVFIGVDVPYQDYIKTEIPFVNYVRDRNQAQIYIMLTPQGTGSGGTEYTITLYGQQEYAQMSDTFKFTAKPMDSEDVIRKGIVRILKMGLMRYVAKTPLADNISIHYKKKVKPAEVVDKWNYWVFNSRLNTFLSGETSNNILNLYGSLSASRVTPDLKIHFSIGTNYNKKRFIIDSTTITSTSKSRSFYSLVVKSLGEHFSIGINGEGYSSTYANTKYSILIAPAIEYSIFPYSEYTRREIKFLYKAGYENAHYIEETIYDKTYENLIKESLSLIYGVKKKWGSISATIKGSHYFHDFSKNRLTINNYLSLNLFGGFNLNVFGSVSMIHDQLSLPKGGATEEEILLQRREFETQYNYYVSIGLGYTFGSIYSNVVNPRF